jgi:hypothetical protein
VLIKDFPVVPRTNTRDPSWFWEIFKLDKNKPPYLPSKEDWVRERERRLVGL